ncbi:hypothetical protein DM44_4808 [Burkholderia cepacia]|uniref:DUF1064 domain-containing protein n=1 Tax=Burkholderia cenocepacia TaxID=95486 RepID=UPI0004F7A827|nr:DUF1064 domain-containing protein [Burkholderia cenocepacia]AIO44855.1 hypothetical protein DM42_4034 [Burkholderia cepacia]KGC02379.1 hypothetical protein DM44_4808 [Burkholderia cepacia]MDN7662714.1 DUF1064 domain-containing protein [Burkholderia cenocepacia]
MTKRTTWPMRIDADAQTVGTARVRDSWAVGRGSASRQLMRQTGVQPPSEFDDIADGIGAPAIATSIARSADVAAQIGAPAPLSKAIASLTKPASAPKYRNRKCEHDGIRFDSEKERARYFELVRMQAAGLIRDLRLQVPYLLTERLQRDDGTWERASKYLADFVYYECATGKQVVEDVKSPITRKNAAYIQKRKTMLAVHGITIKEV